VVIHFVPDEENMSDTVSVDAISSRMPYSAHLTFQKLSSLVLPLSRFYLFLPYFTDSCLFWRSAVTTRSKKSKPLTEPSVKTAGSALTDFGNLQTWHSWVDFWQKNGSET